MANEPTDDLVAFKTTYANSLDKSKQVLGLMGEKNRDTLACVLSLLEGSSPVRLTAVGVQCANAPVRGAQTQDGRRPPGAEAQARRRRPCGRLRAPSFHFLSAKYKTDICVVPCVQKKASDLIDRLDSLASQAVQNRHRAKRDLEQIRTSTLFHSLLSTSALSRPQTS